MSPTQTHRYTSVAIALHWAIALSVLSLIPVGIWMSRAQDAVRAGDAAVSQEFVFTVFQLHKSLGLTVLALSVARVVWRATNPPPPLPATMAAWEKAAAHAVHAAFYVLIIAIPLAGWAVVSSSRLVVDTHLFLQDWAPWPDLPIARTEANEALSKTTHKWLAYVAGGLVVVHVGAALKHQLLARDGILARMLPGWFGSTRGPLAAGRGGVAAFGALGVVVLGGLAWGYADQGLLGRTSSGGAAPAEKIAGNNPTPAGWVVDHERSAIRFSFDFEGEERTGTFGTWTADIDFDTANLGAAKAVVHIDTGSASTGESFIDGELTGRDGFDAAGRPGGATFETEAFRALGGGRYEADGLLTIKGTTQRLTLPFELDIQNDEARATGRVSVLRSDFDIGGDGAVGREIDVDIVVVANRASASG